MSLKDPDGRFAPIIEPVLDSMGFRLVRVNFGGQSVRKGPPILQLFIERVDGETFNLDECASVSRSVSATLDVEDPLGEESSYILEVSSPGLDRYITTLEDFKRFTGHLIKLETKKAIEYDDGQIQRKFRGEILSVSDEGTISLKDEKTETVHEIAYANLQQAKIIITDDMLKQKPANVVDLSGQTDTDNENDETDNED